MHTGTALPEELLLFGAVQLLLMVLQVQLFVQRLGRLMLMQVYPL